MRLFDVPTAKDQRVAHRSILSFELPLLRNAVLFLSVAAAMGAGALLVFLLQRGATVEDGHAAPSNSASVLSDPGHAVMPAAAPRVPAPDRVVSARDVPGTAASARTAAPVSATNTERAASEIVRSAPF